MSDSQATPLRDKLYEELNDAQQGVLETQVPVEPTDEEKRNGWTTESLTAYLAERQAGQELAIDVNSLHRRLARRPTEQNHRYNPKRWR